MRSSSRRDCCPARVSHLQRDFCVSVCMPRTTPQHDVDAQSLNLILRPRLRRSGRPVRHVPAPTRARARSHRPACRRRKRRSGRPARPPPWRAHIRRPTPRPCRRQDRPASSGSPGSRLPSSRSTPDARHPPKPRQTA